jgi:hypothetical protein
MIAHLVVEVVVPAVRVVTEHQAQLAVRAVQVLIHHSQEQTPHMLEVAVEVLLLVRQMHLVVLAAAVLVKQVMEMAAVQQITLAVAAVVLDK